MSAEANEAASIKRDRPILVVLGNPPYSGHSANRSRDRNGRLTFIGELIEDYKRVDGQPLRERNAKWLQDDYVKFIRFAEWRIGRTGNGIIGYITNSSYLDNPTFRGMRQHLMSSFDDIYVLDLHGSVKKPAPDGSQDENVFDIQQGVAILLACKEVPGTPAAGRVHHADLWGTRESKYAHLESADISTTAWQALTPDKPFYLFIPQDTAVKDEYAAAIKITDAMPVNVLGFQTHRDHFAIAFDEATIRQRIAQFRSNTLEDHDARERFGLTDNRDWQMTTARTKLRRLRHWDRTIAQCLYRPFDIRYCYYSDIAMDYPRRELARNVFARRNLCMLVSRQLAVPGWRHVLCTRHLAESCVISSRTKEQNYVFPLFEHAAEHADGTSPLLDEAHPNFAAAFLRLLGQRLGLPQRSSGDLPAGLTAEQVFFYAYAILHAQSYRDRYGQFLKIDFPRIPLTSDQQLFRNLAEKGATLVATHLLEDPSVDDFVTSFPHGGSGVISRVSYDHATQRLWINETQFFDEVPQAVWEWEIGGHAVCRKWLAERAGLTLTFADIEHFQRVVVAAIRSHQIVTAIDDAIAHHGGWPLRGSFQPVTEAT